MEEIKVTINGKECVGLESDTILEIAKKNGVYIPNLCHDERVKLYGACGVCVCEIEGLPKPVRACTSYAKDGQVISSETDRIKELRRGVLELIMSDHTGDCVSPCKLECPAGTNIQGYLKAIANGDDHKAVEIIKQKIAIPASIGRICPHPCENKCRRKYVEDPISIATLKYFAADNDLKENTYVPEIASKTGKKVSVIGAGPGGLSAAYYLALKGHDVTVYEQMEKAGGMLRYGIPQYRLPKEILDREIAEIEKIGVEIKTGVNIGKDITFEETKKSSDATIVAIGAWTSMMTRTPGEDLEGVMGGIYFLNDVASGKYVNGPKNYAGNSAINTLTIGKNVVVVGGGNTAMDACRSAVRLGAENVYVVYRRTRDEMPAEDIEIEEAIEEGVTFKFLTNPAEFIGEDGKVKQVKLQVMELGEMDASGRRRSVPVEGKFETIDVDNVILAIGQKVNTVGFEDLELNEKNIIKANESTFETNIEGVFAIGDATNKGASIAVQAIGEADKCVEVVDSYLNGKLEAYKELCISRREETKEFKEELAAKEKITRMPLNTRSGEERRKDFEAVNLEIDEEKARKEAKRCLECGCHDYEDCKLIKISKENDVRTQRYEGKKHEAYVEKKLIAIERNAGKCINCNLCERVCKEVTGKQILGLVDRGFKTTIRPQFKNEEMISACKDCHECVDVCPTGALKFLEK